MGSGTLSPVPINSPFETSINDQTGTAKTSSSPTPSSADVPTPFHNSRTTNYHHHHHRLAHDDRSASHHHHRSSRHDERYQHRNNDLATRYSQDRHYATEPPTRRDYRDDDDQRSKDNRRDDGNRFRSTTMAASEPSTSASRYHGDSYRPISQAPSGLASERRQHDQYQPRYGESRYDTAGRNRDDYSSNYDRQHQHQSSHYASQQQKHYHRRERSPYPYRNNHTRQSAQRYHKPSDDRHYEPYDSTSRSGRRIVDRGTEEERQQSTIIFTGNLPYDYCERDVAAMFERYGKLAKVTIPIDNVTTRNKGFAFVEFEHRHEAQEAFDNFQGFSVGGRRLKLDWDIGLNKKDTRRIPRSEHHRQNNNDHGTRSAPSSSPGSKREMDTYIPSRGQR